MFKKFQKILKSPAKDEKNFHVAAEKWNIPGLKGEDVGRLCVLPGTSSVLLYNKQQESFVQLSLPTGKRSLIKSDVYFIPNFGKNLEDLSVVVQSSKTFIIACLSDYDEKSKVIAAGGNIYSVNMQVISLLFKNGSLSVVDLQTIGKKLYLNMYYFKGYSVFQEDEKGQFYISSWDEVKDETIKTSGHPVHVSRINIDNDGNVSTQDVFLKQILSSDWILPPIVHSNSVYFFPSNNPFNGKKSKIRKISFYEVTDVLVDIINDVDDWPTPGSAFSVSRPDNWSNPDISGDQIFFYAFHVEKKIGCLLFFDFTSLFWLQLTLDMSGHAIDDRWPNLIADGDGIIYVSGLCHTGNSCKEGSSHLFVLNLQLEHIKGINDIRYEEPPQMDREKVNNC